jgi:hypothetical protein
MKLRILLAVGFLLLPALAQDPRISYAVPYLAPDPSLKTTDRFYAGQCEVTGGVPDIRLPPVFGGEMPASKSSDWMNLSEHNKKLDSNTTYITAISSYELTEEQMVRANVPMGQESWL